MSSTSIKATQKQDAKATATRVSIKLANDATRNERATLAVNAKDNLHLTIAYSLLIPQFKAPTDVPDDIQGQDAHTFAPITFYKPLPYADLLKVRPNFAANVDALESVFNNDDCSKSSAKEAFRSLVEANNGGKLLPYTDIAAIALLNSCRAIRIEANKGMNGKAIVKSVIKNALPKALYLAATGNKIDG